MKFLLLCCLFGVSGAIVLARVLGGSPVVNNVQNKNKVQPTVMLTVTPTSRPAYKTIEQEYQKPIIRPSTFAQAQPTHAPKLVECPIEKDGRTLIELTECNTLIAEHNEALRKRNEAILAENKKLLEQYQNDRAAYEAKRQELYQECINQPLQNQPARADLPYYGAGYKVPSRDSAPSAAQIIEDCKRVYGYE